MNFQEFFGGKSWDMKESIVFWDVLHSGLDLGISFRLHLFAICEMVLLYYSSLGVSTKPYNVDSFSDEPYLNEWMFWLPCDQKLAESQFSSTVGYTRVD